MTGHAVLVTGATGLLGPYMAEAAAELGAVATTARRGGTHPCDLSDPAAVAGLVAAVRPSIVFSLAGMTDVDACERDPAAARRANRDSVANLAAALPEETVLVHVSTDQVYPDVPGPHGEGNVGPVNAYGRSKLAGERAALDRGNALVLRTNFFGPSRTEGRRSLSDFFVERFRERRPVTLFRDSLFSPLHMSTLAAAAVECATAGVRGVYNLGCRDGMSKHDFALAIARHKGLPTDSAVPGRAADMPGRAPRSADLRLDVGRIERTLGRGMPTLAEEIAKL